VKIFKIGQYFLAKILTKFCGLLLAHRVFRSISTCSSSSG